MEKDYGLVLGTNALAELGFSLMDAKGCMVTPEVISGEHSIQPSEATKVPEEVKSAE